MELLAHCQTCGAEIIDGQRCDHYGLPKAAASRARFIPLADWLNGTRSGDHRFIPLVEWVRMSTVSPQVPLGELMLAIHTANRKVGQEGAVRQARLRQMLEGPSVPHGKGME